MSNNGSQPLAGRVAVVTGAGRGIGQGIAIQLAQRGAHIVACSRTASQLDETVQAVHDVGGDISTSALDVTDRASVDKMVADARANLGPISILINNAGICDALGLFHEVSVDAWWRDIEVNLGGTINCTHAVLGEMLEQGQGHIVNVISGAAFNPHALWSAYCTSKAAQHAFTENLASEINDKGVAVFSLVPGLVHTALLDRAVGTGIPSVVNQFSAALEGGRNIPVEQPATMAARLCTGEADALSGRFFDANEDFDEVIAREREILDAKLYTFQTHR